MTEQVKIEKLVHGGQGIGTLADGRRVFVWNALPGETVELSVTKSKRSHAEGVAAHIVAPAKDRISPRDDAYLSTSPWQIMEFTSENTYKQAILTETFAREHVAYEGHIQMVSADSPWLYRNKMEYSFWADDAGLHLALFNRGTHGKRIVAGSSIAMPAIDQTAQEILHVLNAHSIRGSQLKTLVIRANQVGETVASLFVKDENFPEIEGLQGPTKGVVVCYSNPQSPASVLTRELYSQGDVTLTDLVRGHKIRYDVHSFFQVNLPVFEHALDEIAAALGTESFVDMYSGVGTIGLALGGAATLVESDAHNCQMAEDNAKNTPAKVVHATAESALDHITSNSALVVDPPRAGLHSEVVRRILDVSPPSVIYLSCNPITQARDLEQLQSKYEIVNIRGYNFFPRTPHIESLAILKKK